ncbi:MAG: DUF2293 domain-containing protein [Thermoguttaceae bacterium]
MPGCTGAAASSLPCCARCWSCCCYTGSGPPCCCCPWSPPAYTALAEMLADAVTMHATPVSSSTVARTERIPLHKRAEAAVIAWMRHFTV